MDDPVDEQQDAQQVHENQVGVVVLQAEPQQQRDRDVLDGAGTGPPLR
jgi:hypothetical protein